MVPFETLTLPAFGILVIYLLWPKSDFTFRVYRRKARSFGKLPAPLRQVLEEFLALEMEGTRTFKVHGTWQKKRLHLRFRGDLTRGEQQRIRNLMNTVA
jgi:hypothetical protein